MGYIGLSREEEKRMAEALGTAAGKVWTCLNDNSSLTLHELKRKTGLSSDMLNRAIGWLSRENKLHFEVADGQERIRLT